MDKEKIKLIIRNMESLVNALKTEVYSESYNQSKPRTHITDYDEVFNEDDY